MTGKTRLAGILGDPVAHSLSPLMHNAAYEAMGLDICYVPLHVKQEGLAESVAGLRAMGFLGANVTIPHKVSIAPLLDRLEGPAERTGAVNTIVNMKGILTGRNTDGVGFIRSLEEKVDVDYEGASVLLFGAGGAARSIGLALAERGVSRLHIVNRSLPGADEFRQLLIDCHPSLEVTVTALDQDYQSLISSSKIVINATSLGMDSRLKGVPFVVDRITEDHIVCDVVYTVKETPLLIAASEKGATTVGGLGMLLHQGAEAIRLWSGQEPPLDVMRRAVEPERTDIKEEP